MKAIKLLLLFVVVAGGIFLALFWGNLFSSDVDEEDTEFVTEDLVDIEAQCDSIRAAWRSEPGWNEQLYDKWRQRINRRKEMKYFSQRGYTTVNNALRESAANASCNGYMNALQDARSFDHNLLLTRYRGVEKLKEIENMGADTRIRKIESLHKLYGDIRNFVGSSHTIVPDFDTTKTSWTSFDTRRSQILTRARNLAADPLYKEMSMVPGFAVGLDASALAQKIDPQRRRFYEKLSTQIIAYFESRAHTQDRANLLEHIYENFCNQESDYGVRELSRYVVGYEVPEENPQQ